MELQSLRTFQTVVEESGILSASRKLNTVQSNVTARIKRLEEDLGTALFYRKGRGLTLAPSGRVLLDYARQILRLESQAGLAVQQVGEQTGELRIGAMETFTALRLPMALKALRQVHPLLNIRVQTDTSAALIELVLDHKLDCALAGGPVDHPELKAAEVSREELVLVGCQGCRQRGVAPDPVSRGLHLPRPGAGLATNPRPADQRGHGAGYAGRVVPKDESKSFIRDWAPGTDITDYAVSATIEAVKNL